MKPLFDMVSELAELQELENCYRNGEELFEKSISGMRSYHRDFQRKAIQWSR